MDVQQLAAYASIFKDAKSIWTSISGDDKAKVDAIVRRAADVLMISPALQAQKEFLVNGTDELPLRLAGCFLHKNVQDRLARLTEEDSFDADVTHIVKCRQCGALQDISHADIRNLF